MRTPVQGDDASLVDHLDENHHLLRCLKNLEMIVVATGRPWHTACDTPLPQAAILGAGGRALPEPPSGIRSLDPLLRQGRNLPIRGLQNQRRSVDRLSRHGEPQRVVGAADIGVGASAVAAVTILACRLPLCRIRRPFLLGQQRRVSKVCRSLQGRTGVVVPDALQIGGAPRCAGRGRRVGSGRRALAAAGAAPGQRSRSGSTPPREIDRSCEPSFEWLRRCPYLTRFRGQWATSLNCPASDTGVGARRRRPVSLYPGATPVHRRL